MPEKRDNEERKLHEAAPAYGVVAPNQSAIGPSLLDDTLAMTPWERILANDDMVNFGAMLRTAMEKRNAKPR
jgi:hypothetical protein